MMTGTKRILTAGAMLAFAATATAGGPVLDTQKKRLSYVVGIQIGEQLRSDDSLDIDLDALTLAIRDMLTDAEPRLSREQMQEAFEVYQAELAAEQEQMAAENLQAGRDFLARNKERPEVTELESGVQYEVLEEGDGARPEDSDTVVVNYRGTLIDGTEFDSSFNRGEPTRLAVNGVIPGWREVLPLMQVGDAWRVYIPAEQAYGNRGAGRIPPNSTLVFDIELVEID